MSAYMWIVVYGFDSAVIVLVSIVALPLNLPFRLNNSSTNTWTPQEVIMPTLVSNHDEKKKDNRCVSQHSIDTCSKQGIRIFVTSMLSSMTHWVFHWEYMPGVTLLLIQTFDNAFYLVYSRKFKNCLHFFWKVNWTWKRLNVILRKKIQKEFILLKQCIDSSFFNQSYWAEISSSYHIPMNMDYYHYRFINHLSR